VVAERLIALRRDLDLSQYEVADLLHISRCAYSSYETGRRTPPTEILMLLASFFKTTTDYLLGFSDEPSPPPVMDERLRAILRNYYASDERGQDIIYKISMQEGLRYEAPLKPL